MTQKPTPYGCQQSDPQRLCRYDRRAIDRKCDACPRTTDRAYLEATGLWIEGISHEKKPGLPGLGFAATPAGTA